MTSWEARMKKIITMIMVLSLSILLVACQNAQTEPTSDNELVSFDPTTATYSDYPQVTLTLESGDEMTMALFPEIAPNTVNNFIDLCQSGFYDGLTFHRVIDGFMMQGGDPEGTGQGGPGYSIKGEFTDNDINNPIKHVKGVVSMARTRMPDTAGSQFFIMQTEYPSLDGAYAAFGYVFEGQEVIDKVCQMETDANDKPLSPVVIKSMTLNLNGYEPEEVVKIED